MDSNVNRRNAATTNWSLVVCAGRGGSPEADEALARLCTIYWYPVYAFVRHQGHGCDEARDLTQEFFARLIEKRYLRDADPERGRFRSFLMASVRHFLSNERDRARAMKRGGGRVPLPLDVETAERRYRREPIDGLTPEMLFDRRWAVALLEQVFRRLRDDMEASNRGQQFAALAGTLTGDDDDRGYRAMGVELGMSEGAVKVAVHRMRRRYAELLREEIGAIVADQETVDAELRHLLSVFSAVRR